MDKLEAFLYLFSDSFMGSIILPPHIPLVFKTMLHFGGFNPLLMVMVATAGSAVGCLANWGLGRLLLHCGKQEFLSSASQEFNKAIVIFNRYGSWLLLFSFVPVFGIAVMLMTGLCRLSIMRFMLLVMISNCLYYGFLFAMYKGIL